MKNRNELPILKARMLLIIVLLSLTMNYYCTKVNKNDFEELIIVDVTKNYQQKKELLLQDFMEVEYIPLETNDNFLNEGYVLDIGKETILVTNRRANDGTIFVYDRTGKALRKINRKGQGGEEYINIYIGVILDEVNNEIFVNDISSRKILVYDLFGNFKRSFKHKNSKGSLFYTEIFNFDKNNLICYDKYNTEVPYVLVSKQDGSITRDIKIPFKEKKILQQSFDNNGDSWTVSPGPYRTIIPFKGNWLLLEHSSDTIYSLLPKPDYSLRPFLVRTPPIQSMETEIYLMLRLLSDRYIFMETIKNVYDFDRDKGFPKSFFMYDRQEKTFSGYNVFNGDYFSKKEIYMNWLSPVNHEIESWQSLEAYQLIESYNNGELKGRLKEIAANLEEDSNPVIMLIKHKK